MGKRQRQSDWYTHMEGNKEEHKINECFGFGIKNFFSQAVCHTAAKKVPDFPPPLFSHKKSNGFIFPHAKGHFNFSRKKGVYAPLSVPQLARVRDCDQFHPDT